MKPGLEMDLLVAEALGWTVDHRPESDIEKYRLTKIVSDARSTGGISKSLSAYSTDLIDMFGALEEWREVMGDEWSYGLESPGGDQKIFRATLYCSDSERCPSTPLTRANVESLPHAACLSILLIMGYSECPRCDRMKPANQYCPCWTPEEITENQAKLLPPVTP